MKKLMLILVVLSVVLMGCPGPHDPVVESPIDDRFEGTWSQAAYGATLQFSGSNFVFRQPSSGTDFSGPFTFTETTITFNPNEGIDEEDLKYIPWTQNYTIYGNILIIEVTYLYDGAGRYPTGGRYQK